ncbi:hypothetical protein [Methanolobus profundi]|uniref:hypothetical protein n=1 Tax=Methanolobus profundi TaxID=487685 RepID=UPI000B8510B2|nr:hypothetical protein [Methanolobus profundi]
MDVFQKTILISTEELTETVNKTVAYDTLRVGAFNIHVFEVTKASKPEVMGILADIVRTHDVITI